MHIVNFLDHRRLSDSFLLSVLLIFVALALAHISFGLFLQSALLSTILVVRMMPELHEGHLGRPVEGIPRLVGFFFPVHGVSVSFVCAWHLFITLPIVHLALVFAH
jgi:hypothetical protein